MNAEFFIDKAFDAGLQAVFETVFAGGGFVVESAAGEILMSKKQSVHFGMDGEVIFHRALGKGHFRLIGALREAVVAERNDALIRIDNDTTHFAGWVFGFFGDGFGNFEKIPIPV